MEKTIYFNELYNVYGKLLTLKERDLFTLYYEENLSMGEIASIKGISRSAVGSSIKKTMNKLINYEELLGFLKKEKQVLDVISDEKLLDKIKEILIG